MTLFRLPQLLASTRTDSCMPAVLVFYAVDRKPRSRYDYRGYLLLISGLIPITFLVTAGAQIAIRHYNPYH